MITQFTKSVYNGFMNMFITTQYETQEQILEPLTCIIKLGILYLKEDGTKLQIIGNSIHYHTPNVLQGTNRWMNGDNRNDLHNLSNPIKIALKWYIPQHKNDINNLFSYAIKGLLKLGESYNIHNVSSLIGNTISHYINLITHSLENNIIHTSTPLVSTPLVNSSLMKESINKETNIVDKKSNEISDNDILSNNNAISNNNVYKNIWTSDEISIINKLFEIAIFKKDNNDNYEHYIKSIQSILNDKDDKIRDIIYIKTTKIQTN